LSTYVVLNGRRELGAAGWEGIRARRVRSGP
jgi:hypothetical protein